MDLWADSRRLVLSFAADVIRQQLGGPPVPPQPIPSDPALMQPAGCFVSLHRRQGHALRGCIGRLDAAGPLLEMLRNAAISVLSDQRFTNQPVTLAELPELALEVTVLGPLTPVPTPLDFDPPNQGIYLTVGERGGCFLPQVARETGWSRQQLLARLCSEKLGLPADAWQHPSAQLRVFSANVIGPQPF